MYTSLELKLIDKINEFAESYFKQEDRSSKYCTRNIKQIIGNLGIELGFRVCASGFEDFDSEWLYDIVWFKENEKNHLSEIEMVLESEMAYGLGDIKFDFEKLLLANAPHRVMICMVGDKLSIDDIKNYADNAVESYRYLKTGDRVLTLMWDDFNSGKFIPHLSIKL